MGHIYEIWQYGGSFTFNDEKGKPFTIERMVLSNRGREALGWQMPKILRDTIRKRIGSPWKKSSTWVFLVVHLAFSMGLVFLVPQFGWSMPLRIIMSSLITLLVVTGMLWIIRSGTRRNLQIFIEVMLEHLVCPACGYDLRQLAADPDDGCTICPECGGAWKLE